MYGFIYITTCKVNGKKYIGQRKYSRGWENYIGSGTALANAIAKYGRENFSREIICEAKTYEELNQLEYDLTVKFDVVNSENWYNLSYGGKVPRGFKFSEEARKKISQSLKGKMAGKKNPMYGIHRKHTEEEKRLISLHAKDQWGEKNVMYGRTYGKNHRARSVICVELNKVFDCAKRASHELKINYSNIIGNLKGRRKSVGGYHFKYANTEITRGIKEPLVL